MLLNPSLNTWVRWFSQSAHSFCVSHHAIFFFFRNHLTHLQSTIIPVWGTTWYIFQKCVLGSTGLKYCRFPPQGNTIFPTLWKNRFFRSHEESKYKGEMDLLEIDRIQGLLCPISWKGRHPYTHEANALRTPHVGSNWVTGYGNKGHCAVVINKKIYLEAKSHITGWLANITSFFRAATADSTASCWCPNKIGP